MTKYIIMKIDAETHEKTFLKGDEQSNFKWVEDHKQASHYCDYELALLDWNYAIKWNNPNGDRIVIPMYDSNIPPWQ